MTDYRPVRGSNAPTLYLGIESQLNHFCSFAHVSSTSSPFGPLFHVCGSFPYVGWVLRVLRQCLGFAVVGWFRRFCLPPGPLVLLRFRRPPLFFFLALSGFARSRPCVLVLVFSLSLFFCIPLLVSWLSIFHLIFMFISLSSLFSSSLSPHLSGPHPALSRVCVCVQRLNST